MKTCESCAWFHKVEPTDEMLAALLMTLDEFPAAVKQFGESCLARQCWRSPKMELVMPGYGCGEHTAKEEVREVE